MRWDRRDFSTVAILWLAAILLHNCTIESITPQTVNQPPQVEGFLFVPNDTVVEWDTVYVTCLAVDPDSQKLSYKWSSSEKNWILTPIDDSSRVMCETTNKLGRFNISVSVSDGYAETGYTDSIMVVKWGSINTPPTITSLTSERDSIESLDSVRITCQAYDPDDEPLTYVWSADGGVLVGEGPTIQWVAPGRAGRYEIFVDVSDTVYTVRASLEIIVTARAEVLYEADYSTDQVTGNWDYVGLLWGLGDGLGAHSAVWDASRQAMAVMGRSNYGTHSFKLNRHTFNEATITVRIAAPTSEFGCIGLLPKFMDERNYFLIRVNFFIRMVDVIKCENGVINYLIEPIYDTYETERFYTLKYIQSGSVASVKLDNVEIWQGNVPAAFIGEMPLGVAVYGLMSSGAAIFDNLIVTKP